MTSRWTSRWGGCWCARTGTCKPRQVQDFLGISIRRYRGKLLTKPSNDALRRIRRRLSAEATALRGANADTVIAKLNPIIKGRSADYRIGVSKRAFAALDAHTWRLVYKWARFSHPDIPIFLPLAAPDPPHDSGSTACRRRCPSRWWSGLLAVSSTA